MRLAGAVLFDRRRSSADHDDDAGVRRERQLRLHVRRRYKNEPYPRLSASSSPSPFPRPQPSLATNEVDLSTVSDIILHLLYTALDGGGEFQQAVQANNAANMPTSGIKLFSAQNDFAAGSPTVDVPYPVSPWQAFLSTQKAIKCGPLPRRTATTLAASRTDER